MTPIKILAAVRNEVSVYYDIIVNAAAAAITWDVKMRIQEGMCLSVIQYCLVFAGRKLDEKSALSESGVSVDNHHSTFSCLL